MKEDNTDKHIRDILSSHRMEPDDLSFDTVHRGYLMHKKRRRRRFIFFWLLPAGLLIGFTMAYFLLPGEPASYSKNEPPQLVAIDPSSLGFDTASTLATTITAREPGTTLKKQPHTSSPEEKKSGSQNSEPALTPDPQVSGELSSQGASIRKELPGKTAAQIHPERSGKITADSRKYAASVHTAGIPVQTQTGMHTPGPINGNTDNNTSEKLNTPPAQINKPAVVNPMPEQSAAKGNNAALTGFPGTRAGSLDSINHEEAQAAISAGQALPATDSSLRKAAKLHTSSGTTVAPAVLSKEAPATGDSYRFSVSPEVSWNILSHQVSSNSPLREGYTSPPKQALSTKVAVAYNFKNASISTGLGFFNIENQVNGKKFAENRDTYTTSYAFSSTISSSVVSITRVVMPPSWDTITPPAVSTRTALSTATITSIDTVSTLSGRKTYLVVNGDTVEPGSYLVQVRFLTIPLQLGYCFQVPGSKFGIEPQAGIQIAIPLRSYQLVQQNDHYSYSRQKAPFRASFMLLDAGLKINYRLRRDLLLYFKQGYILSSKNIYRNDQPLKYSFSSLYSAFGLSLLIR